MYRHVAMETFVRVVDTGPFSAAASQMSASQQFPKPLRSTAVFTGQACSAHPPWARDSALFRCGFSFANSYLMSRSRSPTTGAKFTSTRATV
jgi:hypothetical protein